MADIRVSQAHVDVLLAADTTPDIRVSQVHVDAILSEATPNIIVSQVHVDVLLGDPPPPDIRVSQVHVDAILAAAAPNIDVSQVHVDVLLGPDSPDPEVITLPASGITFECATLYGTINPNFIPVSGYFQYGLNDPPLGEFNTPYQFIPDGDTDVPFEQEVCDLLPNTTYYFRAVAISASGALELWYGDVLSFTTTDEPASEAGVTQVVIEPLFEGDPPIIEVSGLVIEHASAPDPAIAEVSALVIEYLAEIIPPPPILTPPDDGEDLCPAIDDPIIFGSWMPVVSGEKLWFAETDLPDLPSYYGGWKSDRLLEVGEIRRALSSTDWDVEIGSFDVTLADDDYAVRAYLSTDPTRFFYRKEIELFFITPSARLDEEVAKRIALGFVDTDPEFDVIDQSMSVRFKCRDLIGVALGWTDIGQAQVPRRRLNEQTLPNDPHLNAYHKGAPLPIGNLVRYPVASGERDRGRVSAWYVQDAPTMAMPDRRRFMIAGCAVKGDFEWWYDENPDPPTASGEVTGCVGVVPPVDWSPAPSHNDSAFIFPGTPEWLAMMGTSQPYEDLVGGDGVTRRWTFCYGTGVKAERVACGHALLTWNGKGIESVGDASGALVTDLHDISALLYENVIAVADGEGYRTGNWSHGRTFSSAQIPLVDYISVQNLKTMREDELLSGPGLTNGWEAAGVFGAFGELFAVSEALRRLQICGDFRLGPNRHWQTFFGAINQNITLADTSPLTDEFDIHVRTFKPSTRLAELVTDMPYRYRRDYAVDGRWIQDSTAGFGGNLETRNEQSEINWSGRRLIPAQDFHFVDDQAIKQYLIQRIMGRKSHYAPGYVVLEGNLCLLGPEYDIGRYVNLTHWRGAAANGWTQRIFWILSNTLIPANRRVRLELLDLTDIIALLGS